MFDGKKLGEEIVDAIVPYIDRKVAELEKRLAEIEENSLRYEGIFSRSMKYRRGALITHAGSLWYCFRDCVGDLPSDEKSGFQLIQKSAAALTGSGQRISGSTGPVKVLPGGKR